MAACGVAVTKKKRKASPVKTVGKGDGLAMTGSGSTDLAVLVESWSDVDDWATSEDSMRMDATVGAGSVVSRIQVVGEEIDESRRLLEFCH